MWRSIGMPPKGLVRHGVNIISIWENRSKIESVKASVGENKLTSHHELFMGVFKVPTTSELRVHALATTDRYSTPECSARLEAEEQLILGF